MGGESQPGLQNIVRTKSVIENNNNNQQGTSQTQTYFISKVNYIEYIVIFYHYSTYQVQY